MQLLSFFFLTAISLPTYSDCLVSNHNIHSDNSAQKDISTTIYSGNATFSSTDLYAESSSMEVVRNSNEAVVLIKLTGNSYVRHIFHVNNSPPIQNFGSGHNISIYLKQCRIVITNTDSPSINNLDIRKKEDYFVQFTLDGITKSHSFVRYSMKTGKLMFGPYGRLAQEQ